MKAAVLYGARDLRAEERQIPALGDDEILVRIRSVGVCGSDLRFWKHGRIGPFVVDRPLILGHECAGEVAAVGRSVRSFSIGDRVALEPGIPCRRCDACRSGHYNLCPNVAFLAAPPVNGAFVEYLAHPADFAYRLPDNLSLEEGALIEPLSVGFHAARRGKVRPGSYVFIAGAGPIGLCSLLAARVSGAARIFISDVQPQRLALARKLGADETIDVTQRSVEEAVLDFTFGRGVDVALECSGSASSYKGIFSCVRSGGAVVLVGEQADEFPFPVFIVLVRELDVRGLFRYANTYPAIIDLMSSGKIDARPLVSHRFPLDQIGQALETADDQAKAPTKVMVSL